MVVYRAGKVLDTVSPEWAGEEMSDIPCLGSLAYRNHCHMFLIRTHAPTYQTFQPALAPGCPHCQQRVVRSRR